MSTISDEEFTIVFRRQCLYLWIVDNKTRNQKITPLYIRCFKKITRVYPHKTHVGCTNSTNYKITLLATSVCAVVDTNGTEVILLALIDQGLTYSSIADQAVWLLT